MSLQGLETPNSVNTLTSLLSGSGSYAANNTVFTAQQPYSGLSTSLTTYTAGTLISNTVLNKLTSAINLGFTAYPTNLNQTNLTNLLALGTGKIQALGNSKPATYTGTWGYNQAISRFGFIRLIAYRAYLDGKGDSSLGTTLGASQDFCQDFTTAYSFKNKTNHYINTFVNSKSFLQGVYSTMNDLITADFSGVNTALLSWGQDLIKTGRAIDLATIDNFGLPSNLLKNLKKNNAITEPVTIGLVYAGLTTSEVANILDELVEPTVTQELQIYTAFNAVQNNDLTDVFIALNVQTTNLSSLADLLDPKKLFPNSYTSLTVPKYNTTTAAANSKIYYPIYKDGGVNLEIQNFIIPKIIRGILPYNIALACTAFSTAMMQVKNIKNMKIEKVSQVVTNLEVTNDISVNGTSIPVNVANVDTALANIAKGSGPNGTFLMNDFFPSMTQLTYKLDRIQALVLRLQTTTLTNIYNQMFTELSSPGVNTNTNMATYITNANNEITNIFNNAANSAAVTELNTLWNNLGTYLTNETTARTLAGLGYATTSTSTTQSIYGFMDGVNQFAVDTDPNQSAQVLEKIANRTTLGGQSLIALMREIRNANRLGLTGAELDNDISDQIPVTSTGIGVPKVTGETDVPGSFGGSPESDLIPPNVDIFLISPEITAPPVTPETALEEVILCYCDCWDNL
jgi:hypothetical protein